MKHTILAFAFALLLATTARSADDWFVSASADPNGDGTSFPTAFDTIAEAINVAWPGDTIRIKDGSYDENVDVLYSGVKLIGESRTGTIIAPSSGVPLTVSNDNVELAHLKFVHPGGGSNGALVAANRSSVVFRDCWVVGDFDGLQAGGSKHLRGFDSIITGNYDGVNVSSAEDFLFDNCRIETTGSWEDDVEIRALFGLNMHGRLKGCTLNSVRAYDAADSEATLALGGSGTVFVDESKLTASTTDPNYDGSVIVVSESETATNPLNVFMPSGELVSSTVGGGAVFDVSLNDDDSVVILDAVLSQGRKTGGVKVIGTVLDARLR